MFETYEDALDLVSKFRDLHCKQAAEWQRIFEHYRQTGNTQSAMEASSMINQNNFAVGSLNSLLSELERRGKPIELQFPK